MMSKLTLVVASDESGGKYRESINAITRNNFLAVRVTCAAAIEGVILLRYSPVSNRFEPQYERLKNVYLK